MAVAWSKTLPYNCYELGHCWTPSCRQAFTDIAVDGFKYSLKVYGTLYLLAAILRKKKKSYYLKKLIPETVRSSLFLATNGALFIGTFCLWRKIFPFYLYCNTFLVGIPTAALGYHLERSDRYIMGQTTFLTSGFAPSACASFLAILLERKVRRGILALYLLNLATETAYNSALSQGLVPYIKNGEVWLFSVAVAIYAYLYKRNNLKDNIKKLMGQLIGTSELPSGELQIGISVSRDLSAPALDDQPDKSRYKLLSLVSYLPKELKALMTLWRRGYRHALCRHKYSCMANAFEAGGRLFVVGYLVQATIRLLRALTKVLRNPMGLLHAITHKDNIMLGLFLGSFTTLLRLCHCLLRWIRNKDSALNGLISGFVAGWSMLWYKSSTVAMWITSKLAEILYFLGIEAGILPYVKCGDVIVYTLSTAYVLHAAVFEPHNIRPAYWKFLLGLTNNKFALMNRKLLDVYGTKASTLYPNYWPKYDPRYTNL